MKLSEFKAVMDEFGFQVEVNYVNEPAFIKRLPDRDVPASFEDGEWRETGWPSGHGVVRAFGRLVTGDVDTLRVFISDELGLPLTQ